MLDLDPQSAWTVAFPNDLGQFSARSRRPLGAPVTVASARSGYDAEYYLNRGAERAAGGYYMNAAQAGDAQGNPQTGERMGRAPGGYAKFREILARLGAAEPHATAGRQLELEREAAQQTRRSPVYTDVTIAHQKSISVLHASFREQARRAHLAGDLAREELWRAREARVQEILQEANHAGLEWMQEMAGFTRTGYHGRRAGGAEAGRWERALPVVTTWLQGTSRDGDPHDHSHNVFARMALTESDGKWRALDTMSLRHHLGGMEAIVDARVQSALSREFGVAWLPRPDGRCNEIAGITQEVMDAYSTRMQAVTAEGARLARKWGEKYGREPNTREMRFILDEANLSSRKSKGEGEIDWDKLAAKWDATIGGELAGIAEAVCDFEEHAPGTAPSDGCPGAGHQERPGRCPVQAQHVDPVGVDEVPGPGDGPGVRGHGTGGQAGSAAQADRPGPRRRRRALPGGAGMAAVARAAAARAGRAQRVHAAGHRALRDGRAA